MKTDSASETTTILQRIKVKEGVTKYRPQKARKVSRSNSTSSNSMRAASIESSNRKTSASGASNLTVTASATGSAFRSESNESNSTTIGTTGTASTASTTSTTSIASIASATGATRIIGIVSKNGKTLFNHDHDARIAKMQESRLTSLEKDNHHAELSASTRQLHRGEEKKQADVSLMDGDRLFLSSGSADLNGALVTPPASKAEHADNSPAESVRQPPLSPPPSPSPSPPPSPLSLPPPPPPPSVGSAPSTGSPTLLNHASADRSTVSCPEGGSSSRSSSSSSSNGGTVISNAGSNAKSEEHSKCINGIFATYSKLKSLLGTLVQFAADISPDTGDTVRSLVVSLLSGNMLAEEFHSALQEATNFPLRGFVLSYLKHALPPLQRDLTCAAGANNQNSIEFLRSNETIILEAIGLIASTEPMKIFGECAPATAEAVTEIGNDNDSDNDGDDGDDDDGDDDEDDDDDDDDDDDEDNDNNVDSALTANSNDRSGNGTLPTNAHSSSSHRGSTANTDSALIGIQQQANNTSSALQHYSSNLAARKRPSPDLPSYRENDGLPEDLYLHRKRSASSRSQQYAQQSALQSSSSHCWYQPFPSSVLASIQAHGQGRSQGRGQGRRHGLAHAQAQGQVAAQVQAQSLPQSQSHAHAHARAHAHGHSQIRLETTGHVQPPRPSRQQGQGKGQEPEQEHGRGRSPMPPSLVQVNHQINALPARYHTSQQSHQQHQASINSHAAESPDDEWTNIFVMLNCILGMVQKTKRALAILRRRGSPNTSGGLGAPNNTTTSAENDSTVSTNASNPSNPSNPSHRSPNSRTTQAEQCALDQEGKLKRLSGEIVAQTLRFTEDRVAEVKKKAEEAISEVKRAAIIEMHRAVATAVAESRANERLRTQRLQDLPLTLRNRNAFRPGGTFLRWHGNSTNLDTAIRAALPAGSRAPNSVTAATADDEKELHFQAALGSNCWNCGRPAMETCGGCGLARYCGSFCQHRDWEAGHHSACNVSVNHELRRSNSRSPPRVSSGNHSGNITDFDVTGTSVLANFPRATVREK